MTTLSEHDLLWCLRRMPRRAFNVLKDLGDKVMVSGGFIRSCIANEEVNDVDLFVSDKELAKEVANRLAPEQDRRMNEDGLLPGVHATDNAYTVLGKRPVCQVIHRWTFDTPGACVASFDFTVACAAIWHDKQTNSWLSVCDKDFYADLAAKRLVYRSPVRDEEAGGSMLRVLKFYQKGYRIPLDSLGAVISRLVKAIDWEQIANSYTTAEVSEEAAVAKVLSGLLREVDPNIDPRHQSHLPSLKDKLEEPVI